MLRDKKIDKFIHSLSIFFIYFYLFIYIYQKI